MCEALTEALDKAIVDLVDIDADRFSIVALGGYGRRELCIESDVDLMILHQDEDASGVASDLFRPLWDARLRVGHSVRTVGEARTAARDSFETQTTLLTARLITGSESLFAELLTVVASATKARPLRRHISAAEELRREVEPYLLMAPDVKTGRGGLRTIQAFAWEARRQELIGRFAAPISLERQLESLLRIRNGLHAVTGRPHDVMSVELRRSVANWLGVETRQLLSSLVAAKTDVDHAALERWPPRVRKSRSRPKKPLLAAIADRDEAEVARLVPEWERLATLPHLDPFHQHPVAEHLWRTVEEMNALSEDGWYGKIVGDVAKPETLTLSAFLHDVGKGGRGDHSEEGAAITQSVLRDLGFDADTCDLVSRAVRLHLLLPVAASTRDLDDPVEIAAVAGEIGDARLGRVLYLLSVADSRATGPAMWNKWKESLLRTLFVRIMDVLETGTASGSMPGTTRREVAAVHSADPALMRHIDLMPLEYLASFGPKEVAWHFQLLRDAGSEPGLAFANTGGFQSIAAFGPGSATRRLDVARALAANGIDVLQARMFSRDDGVDLDVFVVRDDRTGDSVPEDRLVRADHDFKAARKGSLDLGAKVRERSRAYPNPLRDGEVSAEFVEVAEASALLSIGCPDRVGRLAQILEVFIEFGLDVQSATAEVRGDEIIDTFLIRKPLPADPSALEVQLRERIDL